MALDSSSQTKTHTRKEISKMNIVRYPKSIDTFFATTRTTTKHGSRLKIVSDGRAGDGYTHWRAIYKGGELVGSLSDSFSNFVTVVDAPLGDLRSPKAKHHEFKSLLGAWSWIKENL
jgi:hypothetical protein